MRDFQQILKTWKRVIDEHTSRVKDTVDYLRDCMPDLLSTDNIVKSTRVSATLTMVKYITEYITFLYFMTLINTDTQINSNLQNARVYIAFKIETYTVIQNKI